MGPQHGALAIALCLVGGAIAWCRFRPRSAALAGAVAAAGLAVALFVACRAEDVLLVDSRWLPLTGSRLTLSADPLGGPLAVFAAAVAAPVLLFTAGYLPHHLEKQGMRPEEQGRFCALMLCFMLSMVLVMLAQDLLVVFLGLELTAVLSFLLIRFDRGSAGARRAARLALVVTVASSLLYLSGVLFLASEAGTTSLPELARRPGRASAVAGALLLGGLLGKSAQFPLHIWLPRAMVAPTPVSAYLHSAALVATGVFVMLRVRPLIEDGSWVLTGLAAVGAISVAMGGTLALVSDELKKILAYSTIAQYGYATFLVGIGGEHGIAGAAFFILAHGLCKCGLFLTAGAITANTGWTRLSEAGGVLRRVPGLAAGSGVCAMGLAGAPLTIGYFKDDLLFAAGDSHGPWAVGVAVAAAALTVAYTARFWLGLWLGRAGGAVSRPGWLLVGPVGLLAAAVLVGGLWTAPLGPFASRAAAEAARHEIGVYLGYSLSFKPEVVMALAAWAIGLTALATRGLWKRPLSAVVRSLRPAGPARWAEWMGRSAGRASDALYRYELRELRERITAVVLLGAGLIAVGLIAARAWPRSLGLLGWGDLPLAGALAMAALGAVIAAWAARRISLVILLSFAGFSLALAFALSGAPNVALVIALVETALTILFLAFLWRTDAELAGGEWPAAARGRRVPWAGLIAGGVGVLLAWAAMEAPHESIVAVFQIELTEDAHAKDVVTAILSDFRGLDTVGEVTVLAVAIIGAVALAWERQDG